jgi:pimeloyl-ACP methyl ester carboxylesterase
VIAVDLPGHGRSPRDPEATVETFVEALLDTVAPQPAIAIGHSMGAVILAAAVAQLRPKRVVYVDTPFATTSHPATIDRDTIAAQYAEQKAGRTINALRARRPSWSERDLLVEAEAAQRWDVTTAAALSMSAVGRDFTPPMSDGHIPTTSMMVHADPSDYLTPAQLADLVARGFTVRGVPNAGHSIWYGHLTEFLAALDDWL